MPKRDHGMDAEIQKALASISPDERAKDRMYTAILRRAAAEENLQSRPKEKPWYLRWQISAGICAAAMACVVVAMGSLHHWMPDDSTEQLSVVTTTETQASLQKHTDTETEVADVQTSAAVTSAETKTTAEEESYAADDEERGAENTAEAPEESSAADGEAGQFVYGTELPAMPALSTTAAAPAVTAAQTSAASKHTETQAVTTAAQTAAPKETTAQQTESAAVQTTVTTAKTDIPLRQNIFQYYNLFYQDVFYSTLYENISGRDLNYLGSGVASGKDPEEICTVLIYAIAGVDPSQQVAVQYSGETAYYIFTAVTEE